MIRHKAILSEDGGADKAKGLVLPESAPMLKTQEFSWIRDFLYQHTGIVLNESKKALVRSRLEKRLRHYELTSYQAYFQFLTQPDQARERATALDLLTTNETYFFREPKHFEFLERQVLPEYRVGQSMRIWSAASSSGEEAYSLAMLAAEQSRGYWEVIGTDISSRMIEKAKRGLYPLAAAEKIPRPLLKKYCLKGADDYSGWLWIDAALRHKTSFRRLNLLDTLPELGLFDIIFLRNVMIYFDQPTKKALIERIQRYLRPGGYFFVSHSESLSGLESDLKMISPSIYRKPG